MNTLAKHAFVNQQTTQLSDMSVTGGATRVRLAEGTYPLIENMALVIRPNLHRNSEDAVGEELFWWLNSQQYWKSQILVLLSDVINAAVLLTVIFCDINATRLLY